MKTRTLEITLYANAHLYLLHEHNLYVIYAKGKRIFYLFGRSFDDSSDVDLNSTNLSSTRHKSGSFSNTTSIRAFRAGSIQASGAAGSLGRGRFLKSSFGGGPIELLSTIQRTKRRWKRNRSDNGAWQK